MKSKIYSIALLTLLPWLSLKANAQGALIFFTEKGEKFWVMINGVVQNAQPETNVKISNLQSNMYRVKIVFQIDTLGEVIGNVNAEAGKDITYIVRRKTFPKTLNRVKPIDDIKKSDKYVIRMYSAADNGGMAAPTKDQELIVYGEGEPLKTEEVVRPVSGASFNLNVDPNSGSFSMSASGLNGEGSTQQSSSTTTTTTTTTTSRSTGNTGSTRGNTGGGYTQTTVIRAMSDMDFQKALASIQAKTFEDGKLSTAKLVLKNNYLNTSQVKQIIALFSFEETKLDFAKAAYNKTIDKNNYYTVADSFTFEASKDELNSFLESK